MGIEIIFPIIFCSLLMTSSTWDSPLDEVISSLSDSLRYTMFVFTWRRNQLLAASGPMDPILPLRTTTETLALFCVWYLKTLLCPRYFSPIPAQSPSLYHVAWSRLSMSPRVHSSSSSLLSKCGVRPRLIIWAFKSSLPAQLLYPPTLLLSRRGWGTGINSEERRTENILRCYPFLLCGFCNETFPYLSKKTSVGYQFLPDIQN